MQGHRQWTAERLGQDASKIARLLHIGYLGEHRMRDGRAALGTLVAWPLCRCCMTSPCAYASLQSCTACAFQQALVPIPHHSHNHER